jgi:hypothetical protein
MRSANGVRCRNGNATAPGSSISGYGRVASALLLLCGCERLQQATPTRDIASIPAAGTAAAAPGAWLANPERLESTDACTRAVRDQLRDLHGDTLSARFTFYRYPARSAQPRRPAPLDLSSLESARTFRTKIREALEVAGVNFAGHYAIVEVGMTGWGPNYWIVDRRTGRAFEFPYLATYLDFADSSTLVIMDSKEAIMRALGQMADYRDACANMGARRHMELRPFYFRWASDRLEQLAPVGISPPLNAFWKDYFGRR